MDGVLLAVLILEAIIIFLLNGKNILSPSFIACTVFIFSTIMYMLGRDFYGHELRSNTVAVIALMIFCIFIGEFIVGLTVHDKNYIDLKKQESAVVLPIYACVLLSLFVLGIGLLYFRSVYRYSLKVGNTAGNYLGMARFVRDDGNYSKGILLSQSTLLCECLVIFFIYSLVYNKVTVGKFFFRYLLIIPCFAIHLLANDNRIVLLRGVIISVVIIIFLIKQKSRWTRKCDKFIIIFGILALGLYILLFRLLGYRTNYSFQSDRENYIIQYTSSGLVGLDKFLNGEIVFNNEWFGQNTLKGVYSFLHDIGFKFIPQMSNHDEFFRFFGGSSNIYTGIKGLVQDFTLTGAAIIFILIGMLINGFMNSMRFKKVSFIRLTLFGMLMYPIAMISIHGVFSTFLGIMTVYMIFYFIIIQFCANIVRDKKYDRRDLYAFS